MKKLSFLFLFVFGIFCTAYSQSNPINTSVYIVRHAEKNVIDPKDPDPELSAMGRERAKSLAHTLKKVKFSAVFSTKYKRTVETGSLVAKNNAITIEQYNPADPGTIAELVKTKFKGKNVLIIGHSNTVLELGEAFGVKRPLPELTEDDYDFLFKIDINPTGYAQISTRSFGKPHHSSVIKK